MGGKNEIGYQQGLLTHRRRWLLGATVLSVATVVGLALSVTPAEARPGLSGFASAMPDGPLPPALYEQGATECRDVLFVGARGSGQQFSLTPDGFGPEVRAVYESFLRSLPNGDGATWGQYGPTVAYSPLPGYTAPAVPVFDENGGWTPNDVHNFMSSIDDGRDTLVSTLTLRHAQCPRERIVLAGFSQGAAVIHRGLRVLKDNKNPVVNFIDGVALISDPDRVWKDGVVRLGTAIEGSSLVRHMGVATYFSVARPTRFETNLTFTPISVCDSDDIVCDVHTGDNIDPRFRAEIHTTYVPRRLALLEDTGQRLASTRLTVRPWPGSDVPAAPHERSLSIPLTVGVAVKRRLPIAWATAGVTGVWSLNPGQVLPKGLRLNSSTGELTGKPTGSWPASTIVTVTPSREKTATGAELRLDWGLRRLYPFAITTVRLPQMIIGQPYFVTLSADYGVRPYTWAASANLPNGVVATTSGQIYGTPSELPSEPVTVTVTDATQQQVTAQLPFNDPLAHSPLGQFPVADSPEPSAFRTEVPEAYGSYVDTATPALDAGHFINREGALRLFFRDEAGTDKFTVIDRSGGITTADAGGMPAEDLAGIRYTQLSGGVRASTANGQTLWTNSQAWEVFPVADGGPLPAAFGWDELGVVNRATGATIGTPIPLDMGNQGPTAATATDDEVMFVQDGAAWLDRRYGYIIRHVLAQRLSVDHPLVVTPSTQATALFVSFDATPDAPEPCTFTVRKEASSGRLWEAKARSTPTPYCTARFWPTADGGGVLFTYDQLDMTTSALFIISPNGSVRTKSFVGIPENASTVDVDASGRVAYVTREAVTCVFGFTGCAQEEVLMLNADNTAIQVARLGGEASNPSAGVLFGSGQLWITAKERKSDGTVNSYVQSFPTPSTGSLNVVRAYLWPR